MSTRNDGEDALWYKDAIVYELHVRAFFDGNNDGVGDFPGLVQKLDYIRDLGVTCLWLLPFYPSPLRDDGYDIADYTDIHPSYGTMEDFRQLLRAAHERGLKIITELVVNHTSDQHPWFQAARSAPPGSPERDLYVWSDSDRKYEGTRVIFTDTETSNWTWDPVAKAYYWHRFFSHQPDLNFDNPVVVERVLEALRFWMDLGVDGVRLDAIPYLIERDGTSCENLRETHAVVKRIRKALDDRYGNRMILAEANQWPADVREYFGDGDECHMAFHFPLMPRIFMALRLEDRHPITEIMAQTPHIPDGCQWALFLRNHDELTLEMVTDGERDYMYLAYSRDPLMRINVGIRRRLAPLMDNNRRRIELLNSLLLSFPGTPIVYYGDEIGMGDNIHLGDRNGVRTPMQWSADRNAGFSRATPARLYSPLILDPVYGYDALNVEAQQSDPSSLLNWMRNLIGVRKLFRVFGRGSVEFLHPSNRKILAYMRRDGEEHVLCVANLSRFAQPVELDLSAVAGMTPVEMLGYVDFPKIGRAPYQLTLGPYGFYWFELHGAPVPIEIRSAAATEEVVVLPSDGKWNGMFEGRNASFLVSVVLPTFLPKQRWFGSKARTIGRVEIRDWAQLRDAGAAVAIVDVSYESGSPETYLLPLAIAVGEQLDRIRETGASGVLCNAATPDGTGALVDATLDDAACTALLMLITSGGEVPTRDGVIRGVRGSAIDDLRGPRDEPLPVGRRSAEQSNTSVRYGDRLILKFFRRLEPGPNPDFELSQFLSERTAFTKTPRFAGGLEYGGARGTTTLGLLQALATNQGDGWQWTLEELDRYFELSVAQTLPVGERVGQRSILALADLEPTPFAQDAIGSYLVAAAVLGKTTAEMHQALASVAGDPAFAPEPLTTQDVAALVAAISDDARAVFDELKRDLARLPDDIVDQAALTIGRRRRLTDRLERLRTAESHAVKTRIHGDYHLGQILRVENDFAILDFEGEPARPLVQRRTKHSPLKDVAGMIRSFSYAASVGLLNFTARRPDDLARLEPWAVLWEQWTAAVFLRSYRQAAAGSASVPTAPQAFEALLEAHILEKAIHELSYELNNRPSWVRIPLRGILALLGEPR